jgi:hypothetical protein
MKMRRPNVQFSIVASLLALLVLSACGGTAMDSAPAADQSNTEQTATEQTPAENTDATAAESTDDVSQAATVDATKPYFAVPAGAAKIDVDPVTQKELMFKNDDMSLNFYGGADLDAALVDVKAQFTAAGYTISKEDTSNPLLIAFKAKAPAGSWGGACAYVVSLAPEGDPAYTQGYTEVTGLILCANDPTP